VKKYLILILISISLFSYSQTGGKKRESSKTIRRGLFHKPPKTSPWIYRKTEPGNIQNRELPKLFKRYRTNGKKESSKILERQNRLRAKRRIRGSDVFHKRKYF
jgi:hypothetical protein